MSEFKTIETQEEFDAAIKKRLEQKDRELADRYKGYMSPDQVTAIKAEYEKTINDSAQKLADHDKTVADLTARATKAENTLLRHQVAAEKGIPIELSGRLVGETKEELEKDADSFATYIAPKNTPPMRSTEPIGVTNKQAAAWAKMLAGME